jgi:hypothetical protein
MVKLLKYCGTGSVLAGIRLVANLDLVHWAIGHGLSRSRRVLWGFVTATALLGVVGAVTAGVATGFLLRQWSTVSDDETRQTVRLTALVLWAAGWLSLVIGGTRQTVRRRLWAAPDRRLLAAWEVPRAAVLLFRGWSSLSLGSVILTGMMTSLRLSSARELLDIGCDLALFVLITASAVAARSAVLAHEPRDNPAMWPRLRAVTGVLIVGVVVSVTLRWVVAQVDVGSTASAMPKLMAKVAPAERGVSLLAIIGATTCLVIASRALARKKSWLRGSITPAGLAEPAADRTWPTNALPFPLLLTLTRSSRGGAAATRSLLRFAVLAGFGVCGARIGYADRLSTSVTSLLDDAAESLVLLSAVLVSMACSVVCGPRAQLPSLRWQWELGASRYLLSKHSVMPLVAVCAVTLLPLAVGVAWWHGSLSVFVCSIGLVFAVPLGMTVGGMLDLTPVRNPDGTVDVGVTGSLGGTVLAVMTVAPSRVAGWPGVVATLAAVLLLAAAAIVTIARRIA